MITSWYYFFFQLPLLPEYWFDINGSARGAIFLFNVWYGDKPYNHAIFMNMVSALGKKGVLTSTLGWYRSLVIQPLLAKAGLFKDDVEY